MLDNNNIITMLIQIKYLSKNMYSNCSSRLFYMLSNVITETDWLNVYYYLDGPCFHHIMDGKQWLLSSTFVRGNYKLIVHRSSWPAILTRWHVLSVVGQYRPTKVLALKKRYIMDRPIIRLGSVYYLQYNKETANEAWWTCLLSKNWLFATFAPVRT